jgi:hypothetical protein
VSSRTRVPERRVIAPERFVVVVQLERPHLALGRAPTPFRRARGQTARATFCGLNEESSPRMQVEHLNLTTHVSIDEETSQTWHSEGREGGIAPRS